MSLVDKKILRNLRDPLSGLTHFIGIIFAIIGLVALLTRMNEPFSTYHAISFSIFGGAMILLYTFSTLYHWLPISGKSLEIFRKLDHIMIFVFIAATYTPICLITLRGAWGWSIMGVVWGITLAGFFMKLFWLNAPRILYTSSYLFMGWIAVIGIYPLTRSMPSIGLVWMLIGGIFYTIGAVIYAIKKPNPFPKIFGFHEIFHVFIMLGSASHFWMVYRYV